ncbi:MAG: AIR synthase-related protein [Candidatus Nealsonbacteria bacterium]
MKEKSEYAKAGVDYTKIEPFKQAMIKVGKQTLTFPNRREVFIKSELLHAHGAVYEYRGGLPHIWCKTQEGLGNKNWIAEWMYQFADTGKTYYENIGIDVGLMAVNDVIAQGAMPVIYTDEVAAGDSEWFEDDFRSRDLAKGYFKLCKMVNMALPAGESPSLRYLIKAEPPVKSAPSLSGCVTGIIAPNSRLITGQKLQIGDHIIGATSSGLHANGISLVIKRALTLSEKFLTELPNGNMFGEEALIPTRSYVALIEALLEAEVDIHALLPGTGGGISKIAFDKRPFSYRIHTWVEIPSLFLFMRELGVTLEDCLTTFNWGIGYYIFVSPSEVEHTISIGKKAGYQLTDIGLVEKGERKVVFEPEDIILAPPGK